MQKPVQETAIGIMIFNKVTSGIRFCGLAIAVLSMILPFWLVKSGVVYADPQSAITAFVSANGGSSIYFQEVGNTGTIVRAGNGSSLASASLYKLFIAQIIYQRVANGNESLSRIINVSSELSQQSENERDGIGNIGFPWKSNPSVTIQSCIENMLKYSDNVCGEYLKNNVAAQSVGTAILRNAGYSSSTNPWTYDTTTADVAKLLSSIASGTFVNQQYSSAIYSILLNQFHRKKIPAGIPSATEVANKTGELHGSNQSHDAAIIKINGKTYVLVVMTALDPDTPETAAKIAKLAADIFGDTATSGGVATGSGACTSQEYSTAGNKSIYETLQYPLYDSETALECVQVCSENTSGTSNFSGNTNSIAGRELIVYNFLSQMTIDGQKLNLTQIAGAMGNLKHESMGYNPTAENSDGYYGLAQWGPNDRLVNLKNFSQQNGLEFDTFEAQLRFIQEELSNRYKNNTWIPLLAATSVVGASDIWQDNYEGTGAGRDQRRTFAQGVYDRFSQNSNTTPATSPAQQPSCENGGMVTIDGYHYPVGPLRRGGVNVMPTPTAHAEPRYAFDFMRSGGTPVYAVYDGVIVPTSSEEYYKGVVGCYRINLKADDGWMYWYGHLQNPVVKDGQRVTAGQKIAEVADNNLGPVCHGRSASAQPGSHLHLDRGFPKGNGGGGDCQASEDCRRDPTFIPFLQALYRELPQ